MEAAIDTRFREWMETCRAQLPGSLAADRRREQDSVTAAVAALLVAPGSPWTALPEAIGDVFAARGFAWNGIYARRGERLELVAAAGPPVCHEIPLRGGPGTSGMCWDALLMNQTLVAADVKTWPGYVSCDGESGLATRSGLVCPIRDASGAPLAVWDLDCTRALDAADAPFFDRLFATLSSLLEPAEIP